MLLLLASESVLTGAKSLSGSLVMSPLTTILESNINDNNNIII